MHLSKFHYSRNLSKSNSCWPCCSFILQLEHPSALNSFQQIINHARNKKIVMFLDYDGTLSPIVDDPDRAFMSDEVSVVSSIYVSVC